MERVTPFLAGLLLLLLFWIWTPAQAFASPSSDFYYDRAKFDYTINDDGSVDVRMEFTLVNDSRSRSIRWVSRSIASSAVENVNVYEDSGAPLRHEVDFDSDQTTIKVYFNGRLGPGDRLTYFITFSVQDLVLRRGSKYVGRFGQIELDPRSPPYNEYVVNIRGPPKAKLFLYEPAGVLVDGEKLSYETQLEPPEDFNGIHGVWYRSPAYYGVTLQKQISNLATEKIRDLKLDLILFNEEGEWQFPALVEANSSLDAVYVDEENNWHGVFKIESMESNEILKIKIRLVYELRVRDPNITKENVGSLTDVPQSLDRYLEPLEYWEVDDPYISQVASSAVEGETNAYLAGKKIIEFVIDRLDYEEQSERLGALQAYLEGSGDCSEYTDLSIALARAIGLPARASYGWGYGDNEAVGHAWLEFYFPGVGWEPADPSWVEPVEKLTEGLRLRFLRTGSDKFAPVLAGSAESYLGRLDTVHIQRSRRGFKSVESFSSYSFRGAEPSIVENEEIKVLSVSEAADMFVSAAEFAIIRASGLLEGKSGGEALTYELDLAKDYLRQAKGEEEAEQRLALSKRSLESSYEIIKALGESPEAEGPLAWLPKLSLVFVVIGLMLAVAIAGFVVLLKGRS